MKKLFILVILLSTGISALGYNLNAKGALESLELLSMAYSWGLGFLFLPLGAICVKREVKRIFIDGEVK
jgi:hypothetical protein